MIAVPNLKRSEWKKIKTDLDKIRYPNKLQYYCYKRGKDMKKIIEEAQKEIVETGCLSVSARRQLWIAFGAANVTENEPCLLTDAVKKRAQLSIACGKKVSKVWNAYDPEDKRPQTLLRQTGAYLQGKCTADKLEKLLQDTNFMQLAEEEQYNSAPLAAMSAWKAAVTALYDEPLLSSDRSDCVEADLDYYDWDAAWYAVLAWKSRDEDFGTGKKRVEEMKFWAWYLEQAAVLLGEEHYRFPKKEIKKFQDKQEPPRPVPKQADLEHFVRFMGVGDFRFCIHRESDEGYVIYTIERSLEAVCPVCGAKITQPDFWYNVNYLDDVFPQNGVPIHLFGTVPMFFCPDHKDESCKLIGMDWVNQKTAWKRYLSVPGRPEEFLSELERRKIKCFLEMSGTVISFNGQIVRYHKLPISSDVKGVRWLGHNTKDTSQDDLEIDVASFGPYIFFHSLPLEEFCRCYPQQVSREEDGTLLLTMERYWVRCEQDRNGVLTRVTILSGFSIQFDQSAQALIKVTPRGIPQSHALAEILNISIKDAMHLPWEELSQRFIGLPLHKAMKLERYLQLSGFPCKFLPRPRI